MINGNTITRNGKQLLLNGHHFADVHDERHAQALHIMLRSWYDDRSVGMSYDEAKFLDEAFPGPS